MPQAEGIWETNDRWGLSKVKTLTCPSEDRLVACGGSLNNSDIRVNDNNFPSKLVVLVNAIILFQNQHTIFIRSYIRAFLAVFFRKTQPFSIFLPVKYLALDVGRARKSPQARDLQWSPMRSQKFPCQFTEMKMKWFIKGILDRSIL